MIVCLSRRIALCFVLATTVAACGGKKTQPDVECNDDDECVGNDVCKRNECIEPEIIEVRGKSNNITPDKVRRQIQERQKVHTDKVDKSLDL